MPEQERRDDVPEADQAEQQQEVWPDDDAGEETEFDVDPMKADEADQLDQLRSVPTDDEGPDEP
ncbi:hypothetical protein FOE78_13770 [Microlunatus elymi]|uniref:Uncharacterized protein n=1 Tax=Microlunatus elymi TaxID=2596828 RepID=A0A516Q0B2_9ACTN|nr:hypothetical protein [Microlunatus elymi]QDP96837.1 hypothetical protein FOE78_13770 [Microlunatus elymi]